VIGPLEIVLIAAILLLLFGGRRIPEAGRRLGTGVRSFFDGVRGIHTEDESDSAPAKLEAPKAGAPTPEAPVSTEQKPS
jgi:sec-independent protein translocase protein TatA